MKRTDLLKQVVPLDLEGLEVLEGEMLLITGGFGLYSSGGNGCGCSCSGGSGCGCGCEYSNGSGCGCGCVSTGS